MSSEEPYKPPGTHEPKKSNTALLVIVVLLVLTIPALCICGGAAAWFFLAIPVERNVQFESPDEAERVPMTDTVSPIERAPPLQPAPGDEAVPSNEPDGKTTLAGGDDR
jgi:hypothetical protein